MNLALKIDETIKQVRPDRWRGVQAREQIIKAALYGVLQDVAEVERIFLIIKAQPERLHSANGYVSPVDYELQLKAA